MNTVAAPFVNASALREQLQGAGYLADEALVTSAWLAQALQRKADAASITLSRITALDPSNANAHFSLGFVQLYRFKPWAAQPALDQAAQLTPANPTLRTLRAVAAAMQLDWGKALTLVRQNGFEVQKPRANKR